MYDFPHYYVKEKYGNKAILSFTSTDSPIYEIETKMFIKSFGMIKINSTIVIIPHHSPYFDKTNEKVIGRFKDEASAWKSWNQ